MRSRFTIQGGKPSQGVGTCPKDSCQGTVLGRCPRRHPSLRELPHAPTSVRGTSPNHLHGESARSCDTTEPSRCSPGTSSRR
jgi:hypothetical protein